MADEEIYLPEVEDIFGTPVDLASNNVEVDLEATKHYQWSGAKLTQDVGKVVPLVYGRHLVAGNLANAFIEEGENETLNMLIALCEGEIESVTNVKINGADIASLYGNNPADPYGKSAEVTVRNGTPGQLPIGGFGDLHSFVAVDTLLMKGVAYQTTTVLKDCEGFILELEIDKLYQVDSNAAKISWYISMQIEFKAKLDTEWRFMGVYEFNTNTEATLKRHIKSPYVKDGEYEIRVMKISDDPDNLNTFGEIRLVSIDELRTENLAYPSTAMMGLRLLAVQQLQDVLPNVTCIVTGKKVRVPKVTYTPGGDDLVDWEDYYWDGEAERFRTIWNDAVVNWDGVSYVEVWSGNPVWCLRDLLLSGRYGLGDFIKEGNLVDSSFLASALYCEEGVVNLDGKKEKRFRLDIVFDTDYRASDAVAMILKSFRGMIDTSSGKVRITIERQTDPVYLFSMGNILKDSLRINYLSGKIPNILTSQFANKDKDYGMDSIEVGDEDAIRRGENIRSENMQMIGCTRISQIMREARIYLNKIRVNRMTLAFSAYMEAVLLQPNDVIEFQHDLPAWGEGGRIVEGSTVSIVKLDKAVTIEAGKSYELMVKNGDDDVIETRAVATIVAGSYTEIEVVTPFSVAPKDYDIWTFGEVEESVQKYRILNISKQSDGYVSITALQYTPAIYDPTFVPLPKDDYVHFNMAIPDVSNLIVKERTVRLGEGTIISQVDVSFKKPVSSSKWVRQAVKFEIYISDNLGKSWRIVGDTDKEYFLIPEPLSKGIAYYIAVASVSENGEKNNPSVSPRQEINIQGWQKAPDIVRGLEAAFVDEIMFTWLPGVDADTAGYEIRTEDRNWGVNDTGFVWRGNATRYELQRPWQRDGIIFFIRAFNTSGIYSPSSTQIIPSNLAPEATELTAIELFQKVFLSWRSIPDFDLVNYEIWRSDTENFQGDYYLNETKIAEVTGNTAVMEVPYNPTYFRMRGVDRFGGGAWSNIVKVYQAQISPTDIGDGIVRANHIQAGSINASHIVVGSINADHIAANSIHACHLAVESLSALSANIGKVIAGEMVGVSIKTAEEGQRVELNQIGLFTYDKDGNMLVSLTGGEVCFINPLCDAFYTFIDSGAFKYHTPYDDISFLKRIEQGVAVAGTTVTLCRWYEKPVVMVGLKKLTSYWAPNKESSQEWCVYADNVVKYDNGGCDFGWKFDIHAKLALSGGVRPECLMNVPFGSTYTTGVCTCEVLMKEEMQIWCNDAAPANFMFGRVCFEVKYKVSGAGAWCSCEYVWEQPHITAIDVKTTPRICQTIKFPCIATWDLQVNILSVAYVDSAIAAGSFVCRTCSYQYQVDCSWCEQVVCYAQCTMSWSSGSLCRQFLQQVCFGYFNCGFPLCSVMYYNFVVTNSIYSQFDRYYGDYGAIAEYGNGYVVRGFGSFVNTVAICARLSGASGSTSHTCELYRGGGVLITCQYSTAYSVSSRSDWRFDGCQVVTYKKCKICYFVCCYQYKEWGGDANSCCYNKWYSRTEVSGAECVLDPSGEVSYLAVAYS